MAVNSTSLITVDEYTIFLGESRKVPIERRAQIEQSINWVSVQVEDYLGRTLMSGSSETEIFSGFGVPHPELVHHEFATKNAPLITSPTPKLFIRSSAAWSAVTNTTYTWDTTNGSIYFTDGNYFYEGRDNYKVVYDYGYANTAAIPTPIKYATALFVRFADVQANSIGIASAATGDGKNKSYSTSIPPIVTSLLDPYVR